MAATVCRPPTAWPTTWRCRSSRRPSRPGFPVAGKDGLIVTSSNCFKAGIDAIKAGDLYGTATEDPGTIAKQSADYAVRYLTGQKPPQSETVQEERVTAANVDQFAEQCSHA